MNCVQLRRERRGAEGAATSRPPSTLANVGFDLGWPRFGPAGRELGLVLLVHHLADPRDDGDEGRPDELDVFEQRGEIALRGEVARAARAERPEHDDASERVIHRHVVDRDHRAASGARHAMLLMRSPNIAPLGKPVLPEV